jgi:hypothetical protein
LEKDPGFLGQRHFNGTFNDHLGGYRGNGGMDLGITWDRITYFFRQSYLEILEILGDA